MSDLSTQVLNCPMGENDAGASTIREYLVELLDTLWNELDDFSGKRPFGNSSWDIELHEALFKAGLVEGFRDTAGDIRVDTGEAYELIRDAIRSLAVGV